MDDIDPINDLNNLEVELNGNLFTYDTNEDDINAKDNLSWNWDCIDQHDTSCNNLIDSQTNSVIDIDLDKLTLDYGSLYSYTFTMIVTHTVTDYKCIDSFRFSFTTKSNATIETEKLFIISVTAIDDEINVNERLRLIGNIINYDQSQLLDQGIVDYKWIEINGLLSDGVISTHKQSTDNSSNLILAENTLHDGTTYRFQLIITQYTYSKGSLSRIGYGESAPIEITTLSTPNIEFKLHRVVMLNINLSRNYCQPHSRYQSMHNPLILHYHINLGISQIVRMKI